MKSHEFIIESKQYVYRIDSKPISDFSSNLRNYKHTQDWSQSGLDTGNDSYWEKQNIKPLSDRGLFAGDKHRTALYATGNANQTRYVAYTKNNEHIVYFDKKDVPIFKKRKTYLTIFDARNFKKLPSGEYFSDNPGKPVKQKEITNPFQYIADQGWIIRITDNLEKVLNQVKQLHQSGKIPHYGAEGMGNIEEDISRRGFLGGLLGAGALGAGGYYATRDNQPKPQPKPQPEIKPVTKVQPKPFNPKEYYQYLVDMAKQYGITSINDLANFKSQVQIETLNWARSEENLNYTTPERVYKVFKGKFKSPRETVPYLNDPMGLGNYVYSNRNGNGDEESGDGYKYRGRGFLQITGKEMYARAGRAIHPDNPNIYVNNPDLLSTDPREAALASIWYFKNKVGLGKTSAQATQKVNPAGLKRLERQQAMDKIKQQLAKQQQQQKK